MKDTTFIIELTEEIRKTLPNYHDYGYVLANICDFIKNETGLTMKIYLDEEDQEEVWSIIQEDALTAKAQLLANVYDFVETSTVQFKQSQGERGFAIKPAINNSVYYYPDYHVALVKLPIYQSYTDYPHEFFFAESDEQLLAFLTYAYERQKQLMRNHVTVFTDTEDGVERSKEKITSLVKREDVLLEENIKNEIYRSIDEFFNGSGEFFREYQIPYKRGILLYGDPGNGKTTLVKSIAGSISAPVAYWQITEYTTSYSIQEVFSIVAKMAPMVLVIEDIDSMPDSVRSVFLNTLDGATSKEGIFLIGTTNYPEQIDPALINRAGRFDRAYEIKRPTRELRLQYLLHKQMERFMNRGDIEFIADHTENFSIAQLNELYTSAALQWHYDQYVDARALIEGLDDANEKARTLNWKSDGTTRVGFGL